MELLYFTVCFLATCIGAICGIGGGIIIKPVLDATNTMSVVQISFLSSCTVLAMTSYSVIKDRLSRKSNVKLKICLPMFAGSAIGGIAGKEIFNMLVNRLPDQSHVGRIQAICMLCISLFTFLYTVFRDKIKTHHLESLPLNLAVGLLLGLLSAFLGIGGGGLNIIIFYYFYSMTTKDAACYSLYVIFFSQALNVFRTLQGGTVPEVRALTLILMFIGGIAGGILGRYINKKVSEPTAAKLFMCAMGLIILVNIYNICRFSMG